MNTFSNEDIKILIKIVYFLSLCLMKKHIFWGSAKY